MFSCTFLDPLCVVDNEGVQTGSIPLALRDASVLGGISVLLCTLASGWLNPRAAPEVWASC